MGHFRKFFREHHNRHQLLLLQLYQFVVGSLQQVLFCALLADSMRLRTSWIERKSLSSSATSFHSFHKCLLVREQVYPCSHI